MAQEKLAPASDAHLPTIVNFIRVETATTRFPLHHFNKSGKIDDEITIEEKYFDGELERETVWKVRHRPGPLAYKVETLVINRIIDETSKPVPKILPLGSLRSLARLADLGTQTEKVKEALLQNAYAAIYAKISYRTRAGKRKYAAVAFTRYKLVFEGEELPDGAVADKVYLVLDDDYLKILNTAQARPVDYDYLRKLPPMAQRLYELLSFQIFAALKNNHRTARMLYSDFCKYAPQTRHYTYDRVKKQMYKVHRLHLKNEYIQSVVIEDIPGVDDDWLMIYTPGKKARAEFDFSQNPFAPGKKTMLLPSKTATEELIAGMNEEERALIEQLKENQIASEIAVELVLNFKERVKQQLAALPFRKITKTLPGFLRKAIENDYELPEIQRGNSKKDSEKKAVTANLFEQTDAEKIQELLTLLQDKLGESIAANRSGSDLSEMISRAQQLVDNLLHEVKQNPDQTLFDKIQDELDTEETIMNAELLKCADEKMLLDVAASLSSYKMRMSTEKYEETRTTVLLGNLRLKHQIPRLSLFSL